MAAGRVCTDVGTTPWSAECNVAMSAGPRGMLEIEVNWTSAVAYPSFNINLFDARGATFDFMQPYPYNQFKHYSRTGVTGSTFVISPESAAQFCKKSTCLSDLEKPIDMVEYLVQVVGRNGTTEDESNLKFVTPVDGVQQPREIAICDPSAPSFAPCDGSFATQVPMTLRITFKYPEITNWDDPSFDLPTHFYAEFANSSTFSSIAHATTFPYEGGASPSQAVVVKKVLSIPANQAGVKLFLRLRLPNSLGDGYFGVSTNRVAAMNRPSAPTINNVAPGWNETFGPSLSIEAEPPRDMGDGGQGLITTLAYEMFITGSDNKQGEFNSGSTPPTLSFSVSPSTALINRTITKADFPASRQDQVETLLGKGKDAYVWIRANNNANYLSGGNELYWSDYSETGDVVIAGLPGAVTMATLTLEGDLTVKLSWESPSDKGLGDGRAYPISSFQYAAVDPNITLITPLQEAIDTGNASGSTTISGLQKGTIYFFSVRAANDIGIGPWFQHIDCTSYTLFHRPSTCGFTAMSFPGSPVVESLQRGDGYLLAAWQSPSDSGCGSSGPIIALSYDIELEDMANRSVANFSTAGATNLTWNVSLQEVSVGMYYRFRCRAVSPVGAGTWSNWSVSVIVLIKPSSPTSLSFVSESPGSSMDFRVSFEPPLETGNGNDSWPLVLYEISINATNATCSNKSDVNYVNGSKTASVVTGLIPGCKYEISVRAQNVIGWGPRTFSTLLVKDQSSPPRNLTSIASFHNQIDLQWLAPTDTGTRSFVIEHILFYRIQASLDANFTFILQTVEVPSSASNASLYFLEVGLLTFCRVSAVTDAFVGVAAVTSAVPRTPSLDHAEIFLDDWVTGARTTGRIHFRTYSQLPDDGKIALFFSGFDAALVEIDSVAQGLSGGLMYSKNVSSQRLLLSRQSLASQPSRKVPRFANVTVTFSNLRNPHWAGARSSVIVETRDATDTYALDRSQLRPSGDFQPGELPRPVFELHHPEAGVPTILSVTANLSHRNPMLQNASIILSCPFGIDFLSSSIAISQSGSAASHLQGLSVFRAQTLSIVLNRTNAPELAAGTAFHFELQDVQATWTGLINDCRMVIATAAGQEVDTGAGILETMNGTITYSHMRPADLDAFALTTYELFFRFGALGLPSHNNTKVIVTFPDGFNISTATILSQQLSGIDFATRELVSLSWQDAQAEILEHELRLAGGFARPGLYLNVSIADIRNPFSGPSGTFQIQTMASGNVLEADLDVPGSLLTAVDMRVKRMELSTGWSGKVTNLTLSFLLSSRLEASGPNSALFKIQLPLGHYFVTHPAIFRQNTSASDGGIWKITSFSSTAGCTAPVLSSQCFTNISLRLQNGSVWYWGTSFEFMLGEMMTPANIIDSGTFLFTLMSATGKIAEFSDDKQIKFASSLLNTSVTADTLFMNAESVLTTTFATFLPIPEECIIELKLPDFYTLSNASTEALVTSINVDGTFEISFMPRDIVVIRNSTPALEQTGTVILNRTAGSVLPPYTTVSFDAGPFSRQEAFGYTGDFILSLHRLSQVDKDIVSGHFIDYEPEVTAVFPVNSPATGGVLISVHGSHYGSSRWRPHLTQGSEYERRISFGRKECLNVSWVSDSTMTCRSPAGSRMLRTIQVTIDNKVGTALMGFSYDYDRFFSTNVRPDTIASITIYGLGFRAPTTSSNDTAARIAGSSCESTLWTSDSAIACTVVSAFSSSLSVSVSCALEVRSSFPGLSYDLSGISTLAAKNGPYGLTVISTLNTLILTSMARFGSTACEQTMWTSFTSVSCQLHSMSGASLLVVMTAGVRPHSVTGSFSSDDIFISATYPVNKVAVSSMSMTVPGTNFGYIGLSLAHRAGQTAAQATNWASDTSIYSLAGEGAQNTFRTLITVGKRCGSYTEAHSIDLHRFESAITKLNQGSCGSASMTIFGQGLGSIDRTLMTRTGNTACGWTMWISDTSIHCFYNPTLLHKSLISITVGERTATGIGMHMVSVDAGALSLNVRTNAATTSTFSMTLYGSNHMDGRHSPRGRYEHTACEATEWESETSVRCLVSQGGRGTRRVAMTAGERGGSTTQSWSADMGTMSVMGRENGAGAGSASVTVHGAGMGLVAYTGRAREGQTGCEATEWESETSVRCLVSQGGRGTRRGAMTAGERGGSMTQAWSADMGLFSWLGFLANRKSSDFSSVSVLVTAFVLVERSLHVDLGHTGCERTVWQSQTSVLCSAAQSCGRTGLIVMTAVACVDTRSHALSVDAGFFSNFSRTNLPGTGSTLIALNGEGLGGMLTFASRFGHSGSESTDWVSDTSLSCGVVHANEGSSRLVLTSGTSFCSFTDAMSMDSATVSSPLKTNFPQTGSASVTMSGSRFGNFVHSLTMRLGSPTSSCETTFWEADTSVRCLAGQSFGTHFKATITAGEQIGCFSEAFTADDSFRPHVSGLETRGTMKRNQLGPGTKSLIMHGVTFGPQSLSHLGRIGNTACESTTWISLSSIACTLTTKIAQTLGVSITIGSTAVTAKITQSFSLDVGILSSTRDHNQAGTGAACLTLHGVSFGSSSFTVMVRGWSTGCEKTKWGSATSLQCTAANGQGGTRSIIVTVGQMPGSVSQAWTVDAGTVGFVEANCAGSRRSSILILGSNMGVGVKTAKAMLGATECEATQWQSDTAILCTLGYRGEASMRLSLTSGEQLMSMSEAFSSDLVALRSFGNTAGTESGQVRVYLSDLGPVADSVQIHTGHTRCEKTDWISSTSIFCRFGHGSRGSLSLIVTSGEKLGSLSQTCSIDTTSVSMLRQYNGTANVPPGGLVKMNVLGWMVGLAWMTSTVRSGHSGCEATNWGSESSVRCRVGRRVPGTYGVSVSVGEILGSLSEAYSVDSAAISSLMGSNAAGKGSEYITMHGRRSGSLIITSASRVGATACEESEWRSQTSIRCKMVHSRGTGKSVACVITLGSGLGSMTEGMSYDLATIHGRLGISNRPESPGTSLLRNLNIGGSYSNLRSWSLSARLGTSACEASVWTSQTSIVCKLGRSDAGSILSIAITGRGNVAGTISDAFTIDSPMVTDAVRLYSVDGQRRGTSSPAQGLFAELRGTNFGSFDATLRIGLGDLTLLRDRKIMGCQVSVWTSDSSIACKIFPEFEQLATLTAIQAIAPGLFACRTCEQPQITLGCSSISTGVCGICQPCGMGSFRYGCAPGGVSEGICRACSTAPEAAIGERSFKSVVGNYSTQCTPCKVCGGKNQAGTQYDLKTCSDRADTVCQECPGCPAGSVRAGCAGTFQGFCSTSIRAVKATANYNLTSISVLNKEGSQYVLKLLQDARVNLVGDYTGTQIIVLYGSTFVTGTLPANWIVSVSSVVALDAQQTALAAIEEGVQSLSDVILITPEELKPSILMKISIRIKIAEGMVEDDSATHEAALFRWDSETWQKQPGGSIDFAAGLVSAAIPRMGMYVVCRIKKKIPVALAAFTVTLSLGLPVSKSDFDVKKRNAFIQALEAAAGVPAESISITSVETTGRRARGIKVGVTFGAANLASAQSISRSLTPDSINAELGKVGLPKASVLVAPSVQNRVAADTPKLWTSAAQNRTPVMTTDAEKIGGLYGLVVPATVMSVVIFLLGGGVLLVRCVQQRRSSLAARASSLSVELELGEQHVATSSGSRSHDCGNLSTLWRSAEDSDRRAVSPAPALLPSPQHLQRHFHPALATSVARVHAGDDRDKSPAAAMTSPDGRRSLPGLRMHPACMTLESLSARLNDPPDFSAQQQETCNEIGDVEVQLAELGRRVQQGSI